MTPEHETLWRSIQHFEFDDPEDAFTFSDRLARENDWTIEYSLQAIDEYKKFMFLICIAQHPLTPSDQIDQVWHLHLLYTQSYWIDFCEKTIGRKIHHSPTKGGKAEKGKFTDWYAKTKEVYLQTFGKKAPEAFWPEGESRFSEINFKRINTDTHWIVKKPKFKNK